MPNTCPISTNHILQDLLGKSDPYLEFASESPDGNFSVVHRTEVSSVLGRNPMPAAQKKVLLLWVA